MADNGTAVAAAQPASAPAPVAAQPAQSQIDPSEFQRLQRIEQQWKGSQPLIEKARSYGFEKPEAFDQFGPAIKTMRERGIDPGAFSRAFEQSKEDNPDQSAAMTIKDVEAMIGTKLSEEKKAWIREQAEREAGREIDGELGSLSEEAVAKLLGEDAPEPYRKAAYFMALGKHMTERKPFPDGHPLAGRLGPVGRDGLDSITKFLKDTFTGTVTALQAKQAAAIGDAARQRNNTTPAGANAGQGKADKPSPGDPDARRARLQSLADAQLAKKK